MAEFMGCVYARSGLPAPDLPASENKKGKRQGYLSESK